MSNKAKRAITSYDTPSNEAHSPALPHICVLHKCARRFFEVSDGRIERTKRKQGFSVASQATAPRLALSASLNCLWAMTSHASRPPSTQPILRRHGRPTAGSLPPARGLAGGWRPPSLRRRLKQRCVPERNGPRFSLLGRSMTRAHVLLHALSAR